jgi:hypothetical protein
MRQGYGPIIAGLVLATAVSIMAIAGSARGETSTPAARATVFIVYIVSQHENSVQHITTARYEGASLDIAMRTCERDAPLILEGYRRQNFKVLMPPECGVGTPWTWVE